jgi:hypothetical protein
VLGWTKSGSDWAPDLSSADRSGSGDFGYRVQRWRITVTRTAVDRPSIGWSLLSRRGDAAANLRS